MAFYKRLAKSLQQQLETTTTKNKLKNLPKQYKYPRASPECFSEVRTILQISLPPTLVTYFTNIMGDKLLLNFGAKFRVNI